MGALDQDQVDTIAKQLKALGFEVNLATHFGLIQKWLLLGPFDNTEEKGFAIEYPPEKNVDLGTTYQGKNGSAVRWLEHTTSDPYGVVDLNKALGKQKAAVAYAFAALTAPANARCRCASAATTR